MFESIVGILYRPENQLNENGTFNPLIYSFEYSRNVVITIYYIFVFYFKITYTIVEANIDFIVSY